METDFKSRLKILTEEHGKLLSRKNERIEPGNGIYCRYKYPVLTADHAPLFWRYDLDPNTNPHLMERIGMHAAFNAGAMKFDGKYILAVRVEGNDGNLFLQLQKARMESIISGSGIFR